MQNYKNVDIIECLKTIFSNTKEKYHIDFKFDTIRIFSEAQKVKKNCETRYLLWMPRNNGTWCVPESSVYIKDSPDNKLWCSHLRETEGIRAFAIEIVDVRDNIVIGNVHELVYSEHANEVLNNIFFARSVNIIFSSGESINVPIEEFNFYKLQLSHGTITNLRYDLAGDGQEYQEFLTEIRKRRK